MYITARGSKKRKKKEQSELGESISQNRLCLLSSHGAMEATSASDITKNFHISFAQIYQLLFVLLFSFSLFVCVCITVLYIPHKNAHICVPVHTHIFPKLYKIVLEISYSFIPRHFSVSFLKARTTSYIVQQRKSRNLTFDTKEKTPHTHEI